MDLRLDAKHDALIESLTSQQGGKAFNTFGQLALFAAVLGYVNQEKEAGARNGRYVPVSAVHSAGGESYAYLFTLLDTSDVNSLREERTADIYNLFTDYVNGGLNILHGWLTEGSVDPVENILSTLEEKALQAVGRDSEEDDLDDNDLIDIDL